MLIRLQKYIADCQIASRRKAESLISDGKIKINGAVMREMGVKVDTDRDIVEYEGKVLSPPDQKVYLMLHKPRGCVTSVKDQFDRKDVAKLTAAVPGRLFPVGRLDYDTSGLLIMTNDGELAYHLTHPKHNVDKVYLARVSGTLDKRGLELLRRGIEIDGKLTAPAKAAIVKEQAEYTIVKITIHEGRNHQVKKMLEAVGCKTMALKRIAIGNLNLNDLPPGEYKHLTAEELKYLKSLYNC